MKPVVALQHIECETLGTIERALEARGLPFRYVRSYAGEAVPAAADDCSALIVMGGPMGVYETDRYPYLKNEMKLIESALRAGRPILGVCLGSQLLAAALGAAVRKGRRKEIGWHPLRLTEEGKKDPLTAGLDGQTVFHWHGDVFDRPKDSTPLASSELTDIQAYRYGRNAYGFLFHLEVLEPMIRRWVSEFAGELTEAAIEPGPILAGIPAHLKNLHASGERTFGRWAELAGAAK